ncbi:hypothetical protein ABES02_29910 [Neobacillus pocheonensis]|uniref:hypothetical protein n=1 Tax=Neobacillus pocheonensis TaxID=363869 RepID=UPI003D2D3960
MSFIFREGFSSWKWLRRPEGPEAADLGGLWSWRPQENPKSPPRGGDNHLPWKIKKPGACPGFSAGRAVRAK